MREPLILPLVAFATGILVDQTAPFSTREAALAAVAIAILALLPASAWIKRTAALLAMFFAGTFAGAWHRPGPAPEIDATSKEIVILAGCVVEPTVFGEDRAQFTLELEPGARAQVMMPSDEGDAAPARLAYGQRIEVVARVRRPHNFNNPGSFDYAAYLARRNIFWNASMSRNTPAKIMPGRCGSRFMSGIFALRSAALDRIDRLYPNNDYAAGMMQAVLIGETVKLERVWTDDFRRTGTFHALVISGVHVTVLAAVLLFLLRLLPLSELSALALTAASAWLYALVSGFTAPVVRAAGGFTLYTLARACFRRARVMNLLAAVALVYLAWDPAQMFEASFQLSFLAVAAIGALAAPLLESTAAPYARGLRGIANADLDLHVEPRVAQFRVELRLAAETLWLWTRLPLRWAQEALATTLRFLFFAFEMLVISATIQIGLALPMAEYFHRVSFTGLSANLLIVPAMNAVVPLGFVAIFTGWHWTGSLAGALLRFSASVAAWHANLEPAWRVPDPPLWLILAFAASLIACAFMIRRGRWKWPAIAASLGLFVLLLWQPWLHPQPTGLLELTAIDVGQGDSLLVVLPRGETMLIDGGGRLVYGRQRKSNLDIGEDVVSPYLWSRGIRRIDVMVATHAHQDHIGGLAALMSNFRPKEFWTGANPPAELLEEARRLGIPAVEKHPAGRVERSGATLEVLAPADDYAAEKVGNNDSLVLRISYGSRSFLLTGDMERGIEAKLLASLVSGGPDLHADVLKVGHHGSRTSSTQAFLEAVSPSVALISAGYENSFGHPHPDILGRLSARHAAVLRTDLDGLVTARTDGHALWFDLQSWQEQLQPLRFPEHLIQ